ncbi:MAG: hypothetical protein U0T69_10125 [Chitinophagales bacterium]
MLLGIFTNIKDVLSHQFVYLDDFLFGILYISISYTIVKRVADKHYKNTIHYKYLMTAYRVKIICSILFMLVFAFYYKGGDTFAYLCNILQLRDMLFTDPTGCYNVIFRPTSFEAYYVMHDYMLASGVYMVDESTRIVIIYGFFLSFFCMSSYLTLCIFFSLFCFFGCWKLYLTFVDMYPKIHREMSIACLFIPSVCFWGAGLLKDSLCIGFLGLLVNSTYELFFKRKKILLNAPLIALSIYAIVQIKVYIVLSFLPALAVWVFARYRYNIKSPFLKAISTPIFLILGLGGGVLVLSLMGKYAEKYAFDQMMRTAQDTQNWLVYSSKELGGSFYTLGNIEYTPIGLIKVFPSAVNVALFRPYIWEAKKAMLVPAAIEGIITFGFTVVLLFRAGFIGFFRLIGSNPEVQFCFVFSIIFAFAVGFTSFNFGALARYKIPFMPFYFIALFILANDQKQDKVTKIKK